MFEFVFYFFLLEKYQIKISFKCILIVLRLLINFSRIIKYKYSKAKMCSN